MEKGKLDIKVTVIIDGWEFTPQELKWILVDHLGYDVQYLITLI